MLHYRVQIKANDRIKTISNAKYYRNLTFRTPQKHIMGLMGYNFACPQFIPMLADAIVGLLKDHENTAQIIDWTSCKEIPLFLLERLIDWETKESYLWFRNWKTISSDAGRKVTTQEAKRLLIAELTAVKTMLEAEESAAATLQQEA